MSNIIKAIGYSDWLNTLPRDDVATDVVLNLNGEGEEVFVKLNLPTIEDYHEQLKKDLALAKSWCGENEVVMFDDGMTVDDYLQRKDSLITRYANWDDED